MKKIFILTFLMMMIVLVNEEVNAEEKEIDRTKIIEQEEIINLFNLSNQVNVNDLLKVARQIQRDEPQNLIAFRATVYYYLRQNATKTAIDYCQATIDEKLSKEIMIEAYYQLAKIYREEVAVPFRCQKAVRKGLEIVKSKYSKKEIEELVNGTDVVMIGDKLQGTTNSVRDLYIMKSLIEKKSPKIEEVENKKIYKYKTDW